MSEIKPKVGEYWVCKTVSVMGNGDSISIHKMEPKHIIPCNIKPIERLYTESDICAVAGAIDLINDACISTYGHGIGKMLTKKDSKLVCAMLEKFK